MKSNVANNLEILDHTIDKATVFVNTFFTFFGEYEGGINVGNWRIWNNLAFTSMLFVVPPTRSFDL